VSNNLFENHLKVSICTNTSLQDKGTIFNPISYQPFTNHDQNNELLNDHSSNGSESFHTSSSNYSSGSDLFIVREDNERNDSQVIYDDDLNIENIEALHPLVMVMSGSHVLNPQSQSIFQYERCSYTNNVEINIDPESSNHHKDFNFQENESIPIFYSKVIIQVSIFFSLF
jgi:hypothetical protein